MFLRRHTCVTVAALILTFSHAAPAAWGEVVFEQSGIDTDLGSVGISSYTIADDFLLASPTALQGFMVALSDNEVNDNGVLDSFNGTLSWGIYSNFGLLPDTLIASGSLSGASLTLTDTGLDEFGAYDVAVAAGEFSPGLTLPAGTYWLALHEGEWLAESDGSDLFWMPSTSFSGSAYVGIPTAEIGLSDWGSSEGGLAFAITGTPVPEPTTAALAALAAPALLRRRSSRLTK